MQIILCFNKMFFLGFKMYEKGYFNLFGNKFFKLGLKWNYVLFIIDYIESR